MGTLLSLGDGCTQRKFKALLNMHSYTYIQRHAAITWPHVGLWTDVLTYWYKHVVLTWDNLTVLSYYTNTYSCRLGRTGTVESQTGTVESYTGTVESHTDTVESYTGTVESYTGTVESYTGTVESYTGTVE